MSEVNEMKSLTLNGTKYNSFPDREARAAAAAKLPGPASAVVGQYLVVEEVDADGKITKVKTVEAPTGGSDSSQNVTGGIWDATCIELLRVILSNALTASNQIPNIESLISKLSENLEAGGSSDGGGSGGGDAGSGGEADLSVALDGTVLAITGFTSIPTITAA